MEPAQPMTNGTRGDGSGGGGASASPRIEAWQPPSMAVAQQPQLPMHDPMTMPKAMIGSILSAAPSPVPTYHADTDADINTDDNGGGGNSNAQTGDMKRADDEIVRQEPAAAPQTAAMPPQQPQQPQPMQPLDGSGGDANGFAGLAILAAVVGSAGSGSDSTNDVTSSSASASAAAAAANAAAANLASLMPMEVMKDPTSSSLPADGTTDTTTTTTTTSSSSSMAAAAAAGAAAIANFGVPPEAYMWRKKPRATTTMITTTMTTAPSSGGAAADEDTDSEYEYDPGSSDDDDGNETDVDASSGGIGGGTGTGVSIQSITNADASAAPAIVGKKRRRRRSSSSSSSVSTLPLGTKPFTAKTLAMRRAALFHDGDSAALTSILSTLIATIRPDQLDASKDNALLASLSGKDVVFMRRCGELYVFRATHGHIRVSSVENSTLHCWLRRLRKMHVAGAVLTPVRQTWMRTVGLNLDDPVDKRRRKSRKLSSKTTVVDSPEGAAAVKRITAEYKPETPSDTQFVRNCAHMSLYIAEHGHAAVNQKHNQRLYAWLWSARKKHASGELLTAKRRAWLAAICDGGLDLGNTISITCNATEAERAIIDRILADGETRPTTYLDAKFIVHLAQLAIFKAANGHTNVPQKDDAKLYRFMYYGKKTLNKLTAQRGRWMKKAGLVGYV